MKDAGLMPIARSGSRSFTLAATLLMSLGAAAIAGSAAAQQKPTVTPPDYGRFEAPGAPVLSPSGQWLAYGLTRVDEERELRLVQLDRDSVRVEKWSSAPAFSADSRYVAWSVGVSLDEQRRLEREKKPVRLGAAVVDLRTGTERRFTEARAFAFSPDARYLALHGYAPEEPKGKGADLRVLDLETGVEVNFGNIASFSWSERGALIGLLVATGTSSPNGVHVYDARSGRLQALDASESTYRHLVWRKDSDDLAVLRALTAGDSAQAYVLIAWRALAGARPVALTLDAYAAGLPDTLRVVEHRAPVWSDDGRHLSIGVSRAPLEEPAARPDTVAEQDTAAAAGRDSTAAATLKDEDLPGVQIWHTSDVQIFPAQKLRESASARRTLPAVWTIAANRIVVGGSDLMENATVLGDWRHAVERVSAEYAWGTMFGRPYHDLWSTNLADGTRAQLLERVRYSWTSPAGRYVLWFDSAGYWTHDLRTGARVNLTHRLSTSFANLEYDTPTDLLPPHGVGGWLNDDRAVFVYDRYDVWQIAPDGSRATRLTRGAEDSTVHRLLPPGAGRNSHAADRPLYMSMRGEWSARQGYARARPGGTAERLHFVDRLVSSFTRADSADVVVFREESRDIAPDYFVTNAGFATPRRVTQTNAFMHDYAWGRSELIEYTTETGRRLQGSLLYPANHDPSRRYPMIVYAYEILTPQHHRWRNPSERDYYNITAWSQHGYFVLLPDIVFRARDPGVSIAETVRPAVQRVADMGLIDAQRVGFIGHSWGGYAATYLAAYTDIFAASVAGAPLTDFVSFMGQIHWNAGMPEVDHWETGQARMEVPYWEDPEAHHRNSPVHNVHNMTTPLLMAHGDKDGVVEFFQATEFYNFARRAGKQMVLLVYEGEDHGFTKKPNQIDYHRRILEWFGHYLRDEPAPAWITDGVALPALRAEKQRVAAPPPPAAANGGVEDPSQR
jgi:dipeptidyl aminopeptidase/acylaminoacyl peptidase